MGKTPPVDKKRKSNAECCNDYKQKKSLNDPSFGEKERIGVNIFRATERKLYCHNL